MIRNLTDVSVRNLKPKTKPYEIPDARARGLRVVVFPSGARSWIVRYRFGGRTRKLTLQSGLTLAAARLAAADAMHQLQQDRDPGETKKAARAKAAAAAADTVQAICTEYMTREGKKLRSAKRREKELARLIYPVLGSKPIASVTRTDLIRFFDRIEDGHGPVMADIARAILSRVFHWHEGRSEFVSPITRAVARRKTIKESARSRVLSDDELRRVWQTAAKASGPFPAIVRVLLLTAARRVEVSEMRWSELDGTDWVLPAARHKAKFDVVRPLSRAALDIIEAQPKIVDSPFVFTTNGRVPFRGFTRSKANFDKACGVKNWCLHDLRRTSRSLMSRAGIRPDISERVMGHAIAGVEGVYDRHTYRNEKADALTRLATLVDGIVNPRDNVTPIRKGAR
jgi:integrase